MNTLEATPEDHVQQANGKRLGGLLLPLVFAVSAAAALSLGTEATAETSCQEIDNDVARLQCYDEQNTAIQHRDPLEIVGEYASIAEHEGMFGDGTFQVFVTGSAEYESCRLITYRAQLDVYNSYYKTYRFTAIKSVIDLTEVEQMSARRRFGTPQVDFVLARGHTSVADTAKGSVIAQQPFTADRLPPFLRGAAFDVHIEGNSMPGFQNLTRERIDAREMSLTIVSKEYEVDFQRAYGLLEEYWQACQASTFG